jgi:F-type H+-transporting ATPase subunit a
LPEPSTTHNQAEPSAQEGAGSEVAGHEESILAERHPTVLNAYPIVLEAFRGRFTATERQAGLAHRLSLAAQRAEEGQFSPATLAVLRWVDVNTVASWIMMATLIVLIRLGTRQMQRVPRRLQCIWEWAYESLEGFARSLIGDEEGRRFAPLLGTFFLYILFLNLGGIVPGFVSPTAALNTTVALALCCFLAVQYHGFRARGLGYLLHFVGEPLWLAPINIPIHILGELARPLSLSVRLFGNIFGEDTVIAQLITLGVIVIGVRGFIPIPAQFPMLLFGIFGSFVQALVFTMLAGSYIAGAVGEQGPGAGEH